LRNFGSLESETRLRREKIMVMAAKDMRVFWENLILASTKTL
jgi:hypothetical protein